MSLFNYIPHPQNDKRKHNPPVTRKTTAAKLGINGRIASVITKGVGTMWCAYAFACIALIALPQAIHDSFVGHKFHPLPLITWTSQAFLQLVLLSILMVGQQILGAASDERSIETYNDAEAVLSETQQIQQHLLAQDAAIEAMASHMKIPLPTVD